MISTDASGRSSYSAESPLTLRNPENLSAVIPRPRASHHLARHRKRHVAILEKMPRRNSRAGTDVGDNRLWRQVHLVLKKPEDLGRIRRPVFDVIFNAVRKRVNVSVILLSFTSSPVHCVLRSCGISNWSNIRKQNGRRDRRSFSAGDKSPGLAGRMRAPAWVKLEHIFEMDRVVRRLTRDKHQLSCLPSDKHPRLDE